MHDHGSSSDSARELALEAVTTHVAPSLRANLGVPKALRAIARGHVEPLEAIGDQRISNLQAIRVLGVFHPILRDELTDLGRIFEVHGEVERADQVVLAKDALVLLG